MTNSLVCLVDLIVCWERDLNGMRRRGFGCTMWLVGIRDRTRAQGSERAES